MLIDIKTALFIGSQKLHKNCPTPDLDTEIILAFIFKKNREFLYTNPLKKLSSLQLKKFNKLIAIRKKLEPVAYITGQKEFFGLNFLVNKNVLIPRPDTEILVEEVLKLFDTIFFKKKSLRVLDVGTGSGCIAITLKKYLPKINVIATDVSESALKIANKNSKLNKTKIKFYCSDLFLNVPKKYKNKLDIITFNPPYLTKNEAKKKSLKYEPLVALTPKSFKNLMNNFFAQSQEFVNKNSIFFIEIGHLQANIIKKISLKYFSKAKIKIIKDLGGFDRLVKIKV